MLRRTLPTVLLAALVSACAESDSPTAVTPDFTISDAVHNQGNEHFYFLPPMVANPVYSGTFDAAADPTVTVCALSGAACGPVVATYTTTAGPGGEVVTLSTIDEHYHVNWHTDLFGLDPATTYRIVVTSQGQEIGYADVDVVSSGKELKNVETGEFIALKDGRTLPIKFRVEEGAVVLDPCAVVTFADGAFEARVRSALGLPTGDITGADALTITQLFANQAGVTDLTGLECFTNLTYLNISGNAIANLSPVAPLTNLVVLAATGATQTFSDLSPLAGLTKLDVLNLNQAAGFSDLSPLAGLTAITALTITNAPVGHDLSALAGMTQLRTVQLDNIGATDLAFLAGKSGLVFLRINGNQISDLSPLASHTGLQSLFTHGNPITDLNPLAGLTNLQILFLTALPVADLSPLAGLTSLVNVNLADSPNITSIAPLASLTNLVTLGMRSNPIAGDVSALAGMGLLENLTATNVGLNSLAFVTNNPLLKTLRVGINNITDTSPLLGLSNLTAVTITRNPVTCSDANLVTLIGNGVSVQCDP